MCYIVLGNHICSLDEVVEGEHLRNQNVLCVSKCARTQVQGWEQFYNTVIGATIQVYIYMLYDRFACSIIAIHATITTMMGSDREQYSIIHLCMCFDPSPSPVRRTTFRNRGPVEGNSNANNGVSQSQPTELTESQFSESQFR